MAAMLETAEQELAVRHRRPRRPDVSLPDWLKTSLQDQRHFDNVL